jgi:hypothetical protein
MIFELVAANVDKVDDLIVGSKHPSAVRTATGLIADLSALRPSESDGLLLYSIGGDVDACWDEQTTTSETTTEVVVGDANKPDKTTTTKKSTFGTARECGQVVVPAKPKPLPAGKSATATPPKVGPSAQAKAPLNMPSLTAPKE